MQKEKNNTMQLAVEHQDYDIIHYCSSVASKYPIKLVHLHFVIPRLSLTLGSPHLHVYQHYHLPGISTKIIKEITRIYIFNLFTVLPYSHITDTSSD